MNRRIDREFSKYLQDWDQFRKKCELKAKDRCILNSNSWKKLRDWHAENYISNLTLPFMFLFHLKWTYPERFESVPSFKKMYKYHISIRQMQYVNIAMKVVDFPTWGKK